MLVESALRPQIIREIVFLIAVVIPVVIATQAMPKRFKRQRDISR